MLIRGVDNRSDQHAVPVDWQSERLGYVPVKDNVTAFTIVGSRRKIISFDFRVEKKAIIHESRLR